MQATVALESVLKRDRAVVVAGVIGVAALAWGYTLWVSQDMGDMGSGMAMVNLQGWSFGDWVSMFFMWAIMMTAMMIPTAGPMILVFATVNRRRREQDRPYVSTLIFASGYILAWAGFAAAATSGNWALHTHALLSSMMGHSSSSILGGLLLISAGVFQWTPIKYACLSHCRTPLGFIMTDWREGRFGALRMGLKHGVLCVGCCWVLMALLFVLGVMNLVWVAALAGFVMLEKVVPKGHILSRLTGIALAAWGVLVLTDVIG